MKLIAPVLIVIALFSFNGSLKAQDTLIMKNGTRIPSKVLEITPTIIKYKKADNIEGPTYTTNGAEVNFVKYQNGSYDTIRVQAPAPITISSNTQKTSAVQAPPDPHPAIYRFGPGFKYSGGIINAKGAQRIMLTVNDPEINDHVKKAKFSKGMGFVGFVAIPTFLFGVGYSLVEAANSNYATAEYWPGVASGATAVVCLGTAITFNVRKKRNMNAALKIYNDKY